MLDSHFSLPSWGMFPLICLLLIKYALFIAFCLTNNAMRWKLKEEKNMVNYLKFDSQTVAFSSRTILRWFIQVDCKNLLNFHHWLKLNWIALFCILDQTHLSDHFTESLINPLYGTSPVLKYSSRRENRCGSQGHRSTICLVPFLKNTTL